MDLEAALGEDAGETLPVTYLRPVPVPDALGGLADMAVFEAGVVALTPDAERHDAARAHGHRARRSVRGDRARGLVPVQGGPARRATRSCGSTTSRCRPGRRSASASWPRPISRTASTTTPRATAACAPARSRCGARTSPTSTARPSRATCCRVQHWIPLAPEERVAHPAPIRYALEQGRRGDDRRHALHPGRHRAA